VPPHTLTRHPPGHQRPCPPPPPGRPPPAAFAGPQPPLRPKTANAHPKRPRQDLLRPTLRGSLPKESLPADGSDALGVEKRVRQLTGLRSLPPAVAGSAAPTRPGACASSACV